MSWSDVSYVIGSKIRKAVLTKLQTEKTPTILSNELQTSIANISRALHELQARKLVECLTPNARVGKIFVASKKGKAVLKRMKEMSS